MSKYECECDRIEDENKKLRRHVRKLQQKIRDLNAEWTSACRSCGETMNKQEKEEKKT